jgi:hypothetical protein
LLGKAKCECYRYKGNPEDHDSILAVYFHSGVAVVSKLISLLEEMGVEMTLLHDLDGECVYLAKEKNIDTIHKILKFQVKGKNISPKSVKTARRQK